MKIKKNVGRLDRTLRLTLGAALVLTGLILGKGQTLLIVIGAVLLTVGLVGVCPAYVPFGFSTRKGDKTLTKK